MFDKIRKLFKKEAPVKQEIPKIQKVARATQSEKDIATAKGEPWVKVVAVELDPDNVGNGAFELDFNEIFVARLVKAGYQGKDDFTIVDQWFHQVCLNVVQENFEQWEANYPDLSPRRTTKKDLGGGRTEVS